MGISSLLALPYLARPSRLLLCASLLLWPALANATAYELSRLASELNFTSSRFAHDLRGYQGYSSVRFSAQRLSREAEQLVEAISRDRSRSTIRSQLDDVRRRYEDLEKSVLRIDGGRQREFVYQHMDQINALYDSLNAEFYYDPHSQHVAPHYYYPRQYERYPRGGVILQYQRLLPQSHYSPRQGVNRSTDRPDNSTASRENRRYSAHRFDHGSAVLERRQRQQRELRHWQSRGHGDHRRTETRRPNHYQ
jgi:hypothetical protein